MTNEEIQYLEDIYTDFGTLMDGPLRKLDSGDLMDLRDRIGCMIDDAKDENKKRETEK